MLTGLSIRDFAIVEQLTLDLREGFTVLTGETGAGKSILIDALQFALGGRAQADAVREGCGRAEVAAEFDLGPGAEPDTGAAVRSWLGRCGFEAGEHVAGSADPQAAVLVRRVLERSGRSRCFINGSAATVGQLRELGELLVDIHGQHEHQSLLRPTAQRELLDALGGLKYAARAVEQAYTAWRDAQRARTQALEARERTAAESEHLRQLIDDLSALDPVPGEWERIGAEQRRLAHGAALLEGARGALEAIAESDDAAQARLAKLSGRLAALAEYDARLAEVTAALAAADIQLEEAARALRQYLAQAELDESGLAHTEERLAALHAAGRRWRCAPGDLATLLQSTRTRLQDLEVGADLDALQAAETQAAQHYTALARTLSAARREAARRMEREVSQTMQDLAMSGGRLEVELPACEPSAAGLEQTAFLVSAHPGGTARPLARVASGGELSRIGLAIAVTAASANPVPTLIFDEVDAGIGGPVGATIGRLLRELGKSRQVLCVTHLPQVASCGDHHLAVRKSQLADGRPVSHTETLTAAARVQEIARMLGGAKITPITQRHAKEMLAGS